MNIKDAFEITKPFNAETLLGNKPVSVITDRQLCESCYDTYCELGEICAECESERLLIDLQKRRNIKCGVEQYAPPDQRYYAIDDNEYDIGRANIVGRGPTKQSAIRDLLDKLAEVQS